MGGGAGIQTCETETGSGGGGLWVALTLYMSNGTKKVAQPR